MALNYRPTTLNLQTEVVEEWKRLGYNVSEMVRDFLRDSLLGLSQASLDTEEFSSAIKESETKISVLMREIKLIDADIEDKKSLKRSKEEFIEAERAAILGMRFKIQKSIGENVIESLPPSRVDRRKASEVRSDDAKADVLRKFDEFYNNYPHKEVIVKVNGYYPEGFLSDFWLKHYKERLACGFLLMKSEGSSLGAVNWLMEVTKDD